MDQMRAIERKAASINGITNAERDEWHRLHTRKVQIFAIIAGQVVPYNPPRYLDCTGYRFPSQSMVTS